MPRHKQQRLPTRTEIHVRAIQTHKLHCITVMPQREVEMDGLHYERVQRPSFPWASVALGRPVSCLSPWQPHFPTAGEQKNIKQCEFTMVRREKKTKNENMQSRWRRGKLINPIKKREKQLSICFSLTSLAHSKYNLWQVTQNLALVYASKWKPELKLIMHLRNPALNINRNHPPCEYCRTLKGVLWLPQIIGLLQHQAIWFVFLSSQTVGLTN